LKLLKNSGILDGYQYLLTSLCKYGLPTGDLYEFSALQILRYEKKIKNEKKRVLEERIKKKEEAKKGPADEEDKEEGASPERKPAPKVKKELNKDEHGGGEGLKSVRPKKKAQAPAESAEPTAEDGGVAEKKRAKSKLKAPEAA
jgi:hypothetical protein